jgi:soluble cytochrome b562
MRGDMGWVVQRIAFFRTVINRPFAKIALSTIAAFWLLVQTYDTVISQFLPDGYSKDAPKVWMMVAKAFNVFESWPLWAWFLILAGTIVCISLEVAFVSTNGVRLRSMPTLKEQKPNDDRGLLDYYADLLAGFGVIAEIINEVSTRQEVMAAETVAVTNKMQNDNESPESKRSAVRGLARNLTIFTMWLHGANVKYRQALNDISDGLNSMLSGEFKVEPDAKDGLANLLEKLEEAEKHSASGEMAFSKLIETMDNLPRIEKDFNRAKRELSEEFKVLIGNIKETSVIFANGRKAGNRLMRKLA